MELSTSLIGKVNMVRYTLRSKNGGSNDPAVPDKEARRILLQTGHFWWKDWITQEAVDFSRAQYQMGK